MLPIPTIRQEVFSRPSLSYTRSSIFFYPIDMGQPQGFHGNTARTTSGRFGQERRRFPAPFLLIEDFDHMGSWNRLRIRILGHVSFRGRFGKQTQIPRLVREIKRISAAWIEKSCIVESAPSFFIQFSHQGNFIHWDYPPHAWVKMDCFTVVAPTLRISFGRK